MIGQDLYPHQVEMIDRLRSGLLAGQRRLMCQAPTGAGKTKTSAAIISTALSRGKRAIFTVPLLGLIDQSVRAFQAEGIHDIGVMQGAHPLSDERQPVQVATVQTLASRYRSRGQLPLADVVLVDEAHVWFEFYARWMSDPVWAAVPFIGLSATPWTKGLGEHYQDLIVVRTTAELIAPDADGRTFLSPFRVFAPTHPDLKGVQTRGGDYDKAELSEAMNKQSLVADVVSTWLARGENRPTLCFAVDRAHAKALQRQFEAAGVPTGYVDFTIKREEREAILERFGRGEIKVVCNVATLTTGVDQDVRCIILARPTKSRMLYVQMIGRGLRKAPGKADCTILDHSDTTLRLGLVTDIHQDWLDDGKGRGPTERKVDQPLPKECPNPGCHFVKPAKVQKMSAGSVDTERLLDDSMRKNMTLPQLNAWLTDKHGGKGAISQRQWDEFSASSREIAKAGDDPDFAKKKADDIMAGLGGSFENLKGSVENLILSIGSANEGILKLSFDKIGAGLDAFSNLSTEAKQAASAVGLFAGTATAAVGGWKLLSAVVGAGGLSGSAVALTASAAALDAAAMKLAGGSVIGSAGSAAAAGAAGGTGVGAWLGGVLPWALKVGGAATAGMVAIETASKLKEVVGAGMRADAPSVPTPHNSVEAAMNSFDKRLADGRLEATVKPDQITAKVPEGVELKGSATVTVRVEGGGEVTNTTSSGHIRAQSGGSTGTSMPQAQSAYAPGGA